MKTNTIIPRNKRRTEEFGKLISYSVLPNIISDRVVDLGAQTVFAHIRKETNGKFNYDVHDIKNYIIVVGELLKALGYYTKIYGLLNRKFDTDPDFTRALETFNGISVSDMPELRREINKLVALINSYNVNFNITYLRRCA